MCATCGCSDDSEAKLTVTGVPDKVGVAARLFRALADESINVDMVEQNVSANGTTDISFTVPHQYLATAKAVVDSDVMRVAKAEMLRVLHAEPAFGELFTAYPLTRNSRVGADLVDQLFNSSEKRLARTLLLLANFGKDGGPQPISTKISQETLAETIGSTRSRVNTFMNKFRKLGLIDYNGHVRVTSSLLSVILHD